jgi:hypothetical protein
MMFRRCNFVWNRTIRFWLGGGAVIIVVGIGAAIVYFLGIPNELVLTTAAAVFLIMLAVAFGIGIGGKVAPPVQTDPWFKTYQTSVVGIIGPIAILSAAIFAWTGVQRQIANQQQIFQAQQRPWVYASNISIADPILHGPDGIQIALNFTLKNVGHSPAQHTFIGFHTYFYLVEFSAAIERACQSAEQEMNAITVFPDDPVVQGKNVTTPQVDIEKVQAELKGIKGSIVPTIVACVSYQFPGDDKFHHTPYALTLGMADKGAARGCCTIPFDEPTIPAEALALRILPIDRVGPAD